MLNDPVRAATVFAVTEKVTVPFPVPPARDVTAMNPELLAAVHGHVLPTITVTPNVPPLDPALNDVADKLAGQLFGLGGGGVSGLPWSTPTPPRERAYAPKPMEPVNGTHPMSDTSRHPVVRT